MRNFLLLLAVAVTMLCLTATKVSAQYCTTGLYTTQGCGDDDYINSFSTTGGVSNITNNNTGCSNTALDAYTYYSGMTHTTVQGSTVNFSIQLSPNWSEGYKIWVDYNNDSDFDDAGELVFESPTTVAAGSPAQTGSFVVPVSTVPGVKRMRVRCVFASITFGPCTQHGYGEIEDYNLQVVALTPCSGTPNAGSATSTITNILCPGANFTLGLSGSDLTSGLTYQWEFSLDGVTWSPIAGATSFNYTTTQTEAIKYYRAKVTCSNPGGSTSTSNPVTVTNGSGPTYAPLPFTESFENAWMNTCNTREIPNNSWRNTPGTGNNSWRRNDDGGAAAWTTPATGAYTPAASAGTFSARFHSNNAPAASQGKFDLHLNCNTPAANKRLLFDFINMDGTDSVAIHLSTDGGATFYRIDSVKNSTVWRKKAVVFSSNSATTIVRFIAYSDDGTTDIGIDNVKATDFDNCSGTPVGGTAINNAPASVCAGVPFTLSVTGQTDAALLTYQWEVATDPGCSVWNPIPGATTEIFTTSQVTTSCYRLKITCNGGAFAYSTSTTVTSPPIPNGHYTIDKTQATNWPAVTVNANFNSFAAAIAAMSCGIGGPVVFEVVGGTGPYNEQAIINPVINASATNTVTFTGNGETITFGTTATDKAVVKLKGADHIRFENLVITQTATSGAFGVEFYNNADSNVIKNCTINLSTTATSNTLAGIVMSGSETDPIGTGTTSALLDSNQIINNTINGGYYGITLTATFAGGANGNNFIKGNTIKDFYQYGIYVSASYNTIIDSNRINRPNRTNTSTTVEGIYYTGQSNTNLISRNRITNPFGGFAVNSTAAFNGITFNTASASAGNDNIVVNNLVADITKTTGAINALNNNNSSSVSYFHNTISLDDIGVSAGSATRGLNVQSSPSGILFYDNMVSVTRAGTGLKHGIYLGGGLILGSDYNDVYVSGTNSHFGYYTTNRTTLATWKTATGFDAGSYSINPVFLNPAAGDYCAANAAIDNKGLYIGIDNDINGNTRNQSTPDIGAFECTPPPCSIPPVTGTTVVTPTTICEGLPVALDLNIGAFGSGQTFTWEGSTDGGTTYTSLTAALQTPGTTIIASQTMLIRARVNCTSATEYSNAVLLTVNPAFKGGTYTIDTTAAYTFVAGVNPPTTAPYFNFKSFNSAYREMKSCGITGPVTVNVVPATGPYAERLRMDTIWGTSVTNTITFNGNGETITFNTALPPTNTERAVIKLVRADYITFDSLVIDASNGASYGYGVQLFNNADSNTFRKCRIISSPVAASNLYSGVVINGSEAGAITLGNTLCDANTFEKNVITGGFYGITVVGSAAAPIANNKFLSNRIEDFYSTGIYAAGTSNTIIDSNTITRPNRLAQTAITGIFSTQAANDGMLVSRNSIRNLAGANTAAGTPFALQQYGIYYNFDQVTPSVVYNNLISDLGGTGIIYALYNVGADNVNYYHNTISLDSTAYPATQVTRGYYQQGQATGIEFKNNIITIKRAGNALKHAFYLDNTTSTIVSDYNDYFVSGSNAHIGYYPSLNRTTLAQWQAAFPGQETHSLNVDPLYQNPAIQDYRPSIQTVDNLGTTATSIPVTTDIKGLFRSSPPDMGAFEFVPIPCGAPVAGTASVTPDINICLQDPITLDITGHSALGTLTFQWEASLDGSTGWTPISPLLYGPQFTTTITPSTYFRARVACGANGVYTNVVHVTLNNVVMAGTYTLGNGPTTWNGLPPGPGNDNFANFTDAVNAMQCGITGKVVINVLPGTYNEQIRINNIRNTNSTNTVTFQGTGAVGDANLTFNSTTSTANYTLKLDSTQYFRFRNITISSTNTTFARAVDIANTASYDSIVSCNIVAPAVVTTANTASAIYANAVKGTDIIIKKNNITNGSNGIYFTGTSNANLALPGHLIDSNTVSGSYHSGIVVQNANDMVISANTVNLTGPIGANAAGINTNYVDSGYRIQYNTVNINNSTVTTYGLYVQNSRAVIGDSGIIRSNRVIADNGNTGTVYGMTVTLSSNLYIVNNTVGINTAGATTYGFHSLTNTGVVNWYNNSAQITSGSASGYAAYFNHAAGGTRVFNNIFANKGTGRALYVNNPGNFLADYNMLYTAGANLVQSGTGTPTNFTSLLQWKNTWNWDRHSLTGRPAFVSNNDLRPDIANDSSWLMHGRGVQIANNSYDFNGVYRPQTLTEGVPDLGAYEFHPTVAPTVLAATPASPAPNTEQTFVYGSDTVMKIKWGATAPPAIEVRRYSGDVAPGLQTLPNGPRPDSMFFHVTVDVPGQPVSANKYPYGAKLYYVESWMGSIPEEYMIGMGRRLESLSYVVGFNSKVNMLKNEISQEPLNFFDVFTGLINPAAQKESDDSTSNRGKDFWVGYQRSYDFTSANAQQMVIYMGAGNTVAHVKIEIEGTNGTPWVRNYTVQPNSTVVSDFIPKTNPDDARLLTEGFWDNRGIHITSDVPIAAYAHIYASTNSGATMLMPTTVWGYEYYSLNNRQFYGSSGGVPSATVFHVIAKEDSTWVEINPTKNTTAGWTPNGGTQPNGSYLVKLNKGDVYQVLGGVLSGSEGLDLSGSYIKSISNNQGQCFPIAVFTGSSRTGIGCSGGTGGNGDLIIQQVFPYQAWGTKYATAPTAEEGNIGTNMLNVFRVLVKDPATIVKRNNVQLTAAQYNPAGKFYQFESNSPDYIEANKPVMVAQYMTSSGAGCYTGNGDPEMFILSPIQQAIKATQFYRNDLSAIDFSYITLVIPTDGLTSLRIDGVGWQTYPAGQVLATNHPNLPGYSVVSKRWPGTPSGSSIVESDYPFTGIVYGGGGPESYGYNLGTLVRNLNTAVIIDNVLDPDSTATGYTCKGAPFTLGVLLPVTPDSITWHFSALPWLNPHTDTTQHNPVAIDTVEVEGVQYFVYALNHTYISDSASNGGYFSIPITYYSPELESCDKSRSSFLYIQILPAPIADFQVAFSGGNPQACEGDIATFTADDVSLNGVPMVQWDWTFHTGATANGQIQTFPYPAAGTYAVKLKGVTADGCISDTTKNVVINPKPPVTVSSANINICPGDDATMSVSSPLAGATYNWYDAATGGTLLGTGTSFTATGVTPPASFWVEGISSAGCKSVTRAQVDVNTLPQLPQPVVTVTGNTATSVTFGWTAIPGATGYQVSTDGGGTWSTPSSGATGTSHTVTALGTLAQTCILVRVLGTLPCQTNTSASVCGCSNSPVVVTNPVVSVCTGTSATFTVQNPVANVTYNWYATPTGGSPLTVTAPGTTFNSPNVSGTTNYYVEGVSAAGCTSSPRTQVTANILPPLAVPNVQQPSGNNQTVNSLTWTWTAVPGAASYQVSLDNGTTWITPSSGATGLSHTVTGLGPVVERCLMVRAIGTIACQTSQSAPVCAKTRPDNVFIPNTFTPNNDGKNDVLIVYGWAIQSIQFMVFNQWGEKIHEVTSTAQDSNGGFIVWDGKYKGKVQPVGVYVYTARIVQKDGTVVEKSGPLNIVR